MMPIYYHGELPPIGRRPGNKRECWICGEIDDPDNMKQMPIFIGNAGGVPLWGHNNTTPCILEIKQRLQEAEITARCKELEATLGYQVAKALRNLDIRWRLRKAWRWIVGKQ